MRRPSLRSPLGACAFLAVLLTACATTAPARPPAAPAPSAVAAPARVLPDVIFREGQPPRGAVGVTASVAAPALMAARIDALAALAGPGATLGAEVYEALGDALAELRLPPETLQALDERVPIGSVFLAEGLGVTSAFCAGARFKDAAGARAALDRLGVELARMGAESTRRLLSGPIVYAGVHGRTLLVSTTSGANAIAGPLVEELQDRPTRALVEVTAFPRVLVPLDAAGLTAAAREIASTSIKEDSQVSGTMARALSSTIVGLAPRLAEVSAARLVLDLDVEGGLVMRLSVEPVPETPLAHILANPTPYKLDPRVGLASEASIVLAWGSLPNIAAGYKEVAGASGAEGKKVRADLVGLSGVGDGSGSCSVEFAASGFKCVCAWRLRPGARPADVLRHYGNYVRDEQIWLRGLGAPGLAAPKMKTRGGILEVDQGRTPADSSQVEATVRRVFGGDPRFMAAKVVGDSLFVGWGVSPENARAALASVGAASMVAPAITAAAARTRASDVLAYADLAVLFMRAMAAAAEPEARQAATMMNAIPGLTDLRMPLELTATTGPAGVYELRLPGSAFQSLARLLRPYLGTMGKPAR